MDPDGNFVVVWQSQESAGTDTSYASIQGRQYAADGQPVGDQFQVNTYTTSGQGSPAVAMDPDGDFVVVWQSDGSAGDDSSEQSIQGQRFAANGAPVDGEFQVNTYTTNRQNLASVAMDPDGGFVVVWSSAGSGGTDSSETSVQGQLYAANGAPVGGEFQVNSYTTSYQFDPAVATDADGNFVVIWQSYESETDPGSWSVQGQVFAANAMPVGEEFQVNTYTTSSQLSPSVAVDADGAFVVAWYSQGSAGTDTSAASVQARRYASNGMPVGAEFQVNTYTTSTQVAPSVASDADGDFVVVWQSFGSGTDASSWSVQGQAFAADTTPVGGEFQVNTYTSSGQQNPAVAMDPHGNFVVTWQSYGSAGTDTSYYSIQGQRYAPEPDAPLLALAALVTVALAARGRGGPT
jgi:hypothetical protein